VVSKDAHNHLITASINGDKKAIGILFKQYFEAMYNVCLRIVGDRSEADDIIQDSFLIAYNKIRTIRKENSFGAWLKRIVINQSLRHLQSRVIWEDIQPTTMSDDTENENENWYQKISFDKINLEIQKLPEGCRQIFVLHLLEGYTHEEISRMLYISVSTSKTQYHRARILLQSKLKRDLYE
jgi:RNA polymerase sigma factor (sigma-70 family)